MATEPPVRDAVIAVGDQRLHYRDWGDPAAPALVLLHAYLMHARSWDTVARGLADRFRVALDLRGFGESAWAADYHELRVLGDVAEFVDALGLATVSVLGLSVGGSNAGSYAVLYPDRVAKLVMVECFTDGDEEGDAAWIRDMRQHLARMRALPDTVAAPDEAVAAFRPLAPYAGEGELAHWMAGGLVRQDDGRWRWRADPGFRRPGIVPGRLNAPPAVMRRRLAGVRCPTLFVVGAESWMRERVASMAELTPHARIVEVPRAGHWVPLDNPTGFLDAVGRFLAEA